MIENLDFRTILLLLLLTGDGLGGDNEILPLLLLLLLFGDDGKGKRFNLSKSPGSPCPPINDGDEQLDFTTLLLLLCLLRRDENGGIFGGGILSLLLLLFLFGGDFGDLFPFPR